MSEAKPPTNRTTPIHGMRGPKRWAYITRQKTVRLATLNEDGSIYMSPLWFAVQDQRIFLPLDAGSRHATNAEARQHVSAVIDSGDEYASVHGISMRGTLRPVTERELTERVTELVFEKYFYVGHPYAESYLQFGRAAGRQVVEFLPQKFSGWDMRETALPAVPEARSLPAHARSRIVS